MSNGKIYASGLHNTLMLVLDLTTEDCPIPFMKSFATLIKMKNGEQLEVITSDPKCYDMLLEGAKSLQQKVVNSYNEQGKYHVILERIEGNKKEKVESTC
jgi:Predicted redox protein, regulator of disulfide bond formation